MIKTIDNFLNKITMYRLVFYYLLGLLALAFIFCLLGLLPYNPANLVFSVVVITAVSWIINKLFAVVFKATTNFESTYITALILALIIAPPQGSDFTSYIPFAAWAAIWAMASKYMVAIGKKHILNPVAFAVALTALTINQSANWWVGTSIMMPFVILGGLLIVRKIKRLDLFLSFFIAAIASILILDFFAGKTNIASILTRVFEDTPIFFFAFVMLTEPLTTPPGKTLRIIYGIIIGFLFSPEVHIASFYFTPETALIAGNIFSYFVSPKEKLMLKLDKITKAASDTYDFHFKTEKKLEFRPGQYLEWTLADNWPDDRGNRRYFTIASSPTEEKIVMGVKFYPEASSFKKRLAKMKPDDEIVASQLAGDFTLPKKKSKKIVLIAGGIGVTPIRSMVKYLLDKGEKRPIVVVYVNRDEKDIAYKEIFDEAEQKLGIKTVHTLTDVKNIPENWPGKRGRLNEKMIIEEIPDYKDRMFYISGPHEMTTAIKKILRNMGVKRRKIKTDYFPGFA